VTRQLTRRRCLRCLHRHRGVPNTSAAPRPNVQLIYTPARLHVPQPPSEDGTAPPGSLLFSEDCRAALSGLPPGVQRSIAFVAGPVNHLANGAGAGGVVLGEADPAVNFARPTTEEETALVDATLAAARL